ncbi:thyroid adenoma-associated protein homolog [Neocloeon triangulifer]|uniref:thyroid adenoma-associated protein homolog n=1 Tax=Neocloeon triangulifer TaxID=2078957 RepID=UPI00286F5CA7|nr:thyroid adenoma-associated protein homolog [Neocloeon triangulifer]
MATMNLRITGSKSKKIAVKSMNPSQFPNHCFDFCEQLHSGLIHEFSSITKKVRLFQLVCSAAPPEEILQEVKEISSQGWPNNLDSAEKTQFLQCLVVLYLLADYQGHVKNAFFKILDQSVKCEHSWDKVAELFSQYLRSAVKKTSDQSSAAGTITHLTKSLALAEKFIIPCWKDTLEFLKCGVKTHSELKDLSEMVAVEQQIIFRGLHILSQAASTVLQVANKTLSFGLGATDQLSNLLGTFTELLAEPPPQLPFDTLSSCAMSAILCADRLQENLSNATKILQVLAVIMVEKEQVETSNWIALKDCSTPVKLSLCSALLGIYKVEELARINLKNEHLLLKVFEFLADKSARSSESNIILGSCRSIAALGKLLPQAAILCPDLIRSLLPKATEHCIVYLEHHMDSVRHATKAFLASFLAACQNDETSTSYVINSFKKLPSDSKAKFFGVAALGSSLGSSTVLMHFSGLVDWLLNSLKNTTLAPHASSTLEVLMKSHINIEVPVELWYNTWIMPVVLMMPCPALEPVLSKAVELRPQTLNFIIEVCSNELSKSSASKDSANHLKVLLSCLMMAKKHAKCDKKDWMEVVGLQRLMLALCHSDDEVRLAALSFLTETRKRTEPLNAIELMSLLTGFKYCGDSDSPSSCHTAYGILKKLLSRVADSYRAAKNKEHIHEGYVNFVSHLCANAFSDLFPGSSLCRRSFSLQALCLFRDLMASEEPWSGVWRQQTTTDHAEILLSCLTDTYEVNKKMALELLKAFPTPTLGLDKQECLEELLQKCLLMSESHKPPECTNAACVLSLIVSCIDVEPILHKLNNSKSSSCLIICEKLLQRLELQLNVAKKSILKASAQGPMYGTLYCLRYLIIEQDLRSLSTGSETNSWRFLINQLVTFCFEMNATVAPIVNSSSPEGHLPMDFETDINLPEEIDSLTMEEAQGFPKVTAQMVLLCAWRTVKEVSLTLGDLAAKAPASEAEQYLLSNQQLLLIGEHFTSLLCETKHRGAFEQAYVGFCKLCSWLWKVPSGVLPQLPAKWLDELMLGICGRDQEKNSSSIKLTKLCTTRRSAGVPFIVQALITTELEVRAKPECFHKTVSTLLRLAKVSGSEGQLHALNILRALFRSAHLGEHVAPYISEGFVVAVQAFKSANWAERNAATLMFSALMSRVFGVKHTPGHDDLPRKNRMTGRIFFKLYPDLFGLLADELESVSASIREDKVVAGSLYPVLLLLARLYPSSLEGTDSALNLLSLLDYVSVCTASPVMHTRYLAAKALVPLVEPQQAPAYIYSLNFQPQPQNTLHGILLQVGKLAKDLPVTDELVIVYTDKISQGSYLLKPEHKCAVTKGAFLDFLLEVAAKFSELNLKLMSNSINNQLLDVLHCEDQFGFAVMKQKAARLLLQMTIAIKNFEQKEQVIVDVLSHQLPLVVHEACVFILRHTELSDQEINGGCHKFVGLDLGKREGKLLDTQIKSSNSIAQALVQKALEWTPKNGQMVQYETRIIIYLATIRLGKSALLSEWTFGNNHITNLESKVETLLNFYQEQRLGPASFITLACAGELLHNTIKEPSKNLLLKYTSCLLDCAQGDFSFESNMVVAQSLYSNKDIIFGLFDTVTATSFCTVMEILQQSSPSGQDIVLRLNPSTVNVTRSRALEAVAQQFAVDEKVSLELKLAILIVWTFGENVLNDFGCDKNSIQFDDEDHRKVFEQGDVDVTSEELKLSEAASSALKTLVTKNGKETINSAMNTPIEWTPYGSFTCRDILFKVKKFSTSTSHFLDIQHQLCILRKMQYHEFEKSLMLDNS